MNEYERGVLLYSAYPGGSVSLVTEDEIKSWEAVVALRLFNDTEGLIGGEGDVHWLTAIGNGCAVSCSRQV